MDTSIRRIDICSVCQKPVNSEAEDFCRCKFADGSILEQICITSPRTEQQVVQQDK